MLHYLVFFVCAHFIAFSKSESHSEKGRESERERESVGEKVALLRNAISSKSQRDFSLLLFFILFLFHEIQTFLNYSLSFIAALSLKCRLTVMTKRFYSTASYTISSTFTAVAC